VRPEHVPTEQPVAPATQAETGGVISGTVTDAQGQPLRNVEVRAQTPAEIAGRPLARYVAQSDEQGTYSMEVSSYPYRLSASIKVLYRGKQWERQLHPTDDSADIVTPKGHIGKDFSWQLTGLVPGQDPEGYTSYYGGYIQLQWGENSSNPSLLSPEPILQVTLTPTSPLIDGSIGKVLKLKRTIKATTTREGPLERTCYLHDIPIGPYRATATLILPNGDIHPLSVSTNTERRGGRVPGESADLEFSPSFAKSSDNLSLFLDFSLGRAVFNEILGMLTQ